MSQAHKDAIRAGLRAYHAGCKKKAKPAPKKRGRPKGATGKRKVPVGTVVKRPRGRPRKHPVKAKASAVPVRMSAEDEKNLFHAHLKAVGAAQAFRAKRGY